MTINSNLQFDRDFLIKTIKDAKKILKINNTRDDINCLLNMTIINFSNLVDALDGKCSLTQEIYYRQLDFDELKKQFLNKAAIDYKAIGEELIDLIISLVENHKFLADDYEEYKGNTSPIESIQKTFYLYEE